MATLRVRDPYQNVFEIDATARAFWEHREGHEILDDAEPDALPVEAGGPAPAVAEVQGKPGEPRAKPKTRSKADKIEDK